MAIKIQLSNSNGIKLFTKGTYVDDDIYVYLEKETSNDNSLEKIIDRTITNYENKNVLNIRHNAFAYCSLLTNISFPNCTSIGMSAFFGCASLQEASFPNCSYIGASAFCYCTSLTNISFPICTSIGSCAFYNCESLQEVSFPMCNHIGFNAFKACTSLQSVYLNVSSVPQLSVRNTFYDTPMSDSSYLGYYGSIYVPVSLYEAFCSATNWAAYSSRIVSYNF